MIRLSVVTQLLLKKAQRDNVENLIASYLFKTIKQIYALRTTLPSSTRAEVAAAAI